MVATTTEDPATEPATEPQSTPDTSGATNGAATPKGETNPSDTEAKLIDIQVETGTSSGSARETLKANHGEAATIGKPYIRGTVTELTAAEVELEEATPRGG